MSLKTHRSTLAITPTTIRVSQGSGPP